MRRPTISFLLLNSCFISLLFYSIFIFSPSVAFAGTCDAPSVCSLDWSSTPTPGAPCVSDPDHYVYGTSQVCFPDKAPCVPSCGILGNGRCCDPNPKNPPHVTPTLPPGKTPPPPCAKFDPKKGCLAINTAIGTISTNVGDITTTIFQILLGLSGGVATLLIIGAGYQMMTSQGNPEKVKEARERLTAAIVGLLFIIFSITILQTIGVDILHIPGLSK